MHNIIKQYIADVLDIKPEQIVLERPKNQKLGHYATPLSFVLAKERSSSPQQVAMEIQKKLEDVNSSSLEPIFYEITSVGGFINFRLSAQFLSQSAHKALLQQKDFGKKENNKAILFEFVSANPTGPLHIGHARGAILGDSLVRIGKHLGYKIIKEYYINDYGRQIYLLGISIYWSMRDVLGLFVCYPDEYYRGDYIIEIAKKALEYFGEDICKLDASEEIVEKLSVFGKEMMLQEIKNNLEQINIDFDSFISEKSLYKDWAFIYDELQRNEAVYNKDSKVWLKTQSLGDDEDRVIIRENGNPTYLAGDIIYHYNKFKRNFDSYINIWGADHHGYIARVKAALSLLGFESSRLEIILSQMVSLLKAGEPYKMSKRAGNFILMSDVVNEVGSDVLRFVFLSKKSDTHLEFDVEEIKKEDSNNPIYYINYAHARIHTLFKKVNKPYSYIDECSLLSLLTYEDETLRNDCVELLFLSLQLPQVIEDSFKIRNLVKMSDYLKNLAATFHRFYNAHKIIGSIMEKELLKLCQMVALSLKLGLELLGIQALEAMHKEIGQEK